MSEQTIRQEVQDAVDGIAKPNNFAKIINTKSKEIFNDNKAKGFWDLDMSDDCIADLSLIFGSGKTISQQEFRQNILETLQEHKVKCEHNIGEKLALITSEVSEALEGVRKDLKDDHLPEYSMLSVELADAFIRIMDLAGYLNIPLGDIIEKKLEYNRLRPYRHDKKF